MTPTFDYPNDDLRRLNHVQVKGSHNSYHIEPAGTDVVDWHYTMAPLDEQLASQGVRAFELDMRFSHALGVFEVYHLPVVDEQTTCRLFTDCLSTLKRWSDAHPAHHALLVMIEPKDNVADVNAEAYFASFEGEILSVWPRERIVTPADVQGTAATLRDAVTTSGFPTLGATRGKVLFFYNNTGDIQRLYTHGRTSLDGRLAFAESSVDDPFAAWLVLNDPVGSADAIDDAAAKGFMVRTRADAGAAGGDAASRDIALAGGAHIVSTDYPAPVTSTDYVMEIPGGTPSRCNPVSAPAGCLAEDIESPVFVH